MGRERLDLTGRRFGKLTVTGENPSPYISPGGKPIRRWDCVCDCGNRVTVLQNQLTTKRNPAQSCGCAHAEAMRRVGAERQAYRVCTVCGKRYPAPPSSNRTTCSPECSAARKKQIRTGNRRPWGEEKKAALSAAIRSDPERLAAARKSADAATAAAQQSTKSGPFETNVNAKNWMLKAPDNTVHEFNNLSKFIREHPNWFPNPHSARTALSAVANGKRNVGQYKGWQVIYSGPREEK